MTAEDWSPYGIGDPDEDGWYPDYRPVPESIKPQPAAAIAPLPKVEVDGSLLALVSNWSLVMADLSLHHHVDLWDPAVLARPWPGIRNMIASLLDQEGTRLRRQLTRR